MAGTVPATPTANASSPGSGGVPQHPLVLPWDVCEPILDALMGLGAIGDLDDRLLSAEPRRAAAYQLLDTGLSKVDPQHLVFDASFEYPPEVVALAQQVLDRVGRYLREQPFDD
jgi:hypothetical protein